MAIKRIKEFNFLMRKVFKFLTFLQKRAINFTNVRYYYYLTRLHFKLYFKKDLIEEAVNNTEEFKAAARRHVRIASKSLMEKGLQKDSVKKLSNAVAKTFKDTLLLEAKL